MAEPCSVLAAIRYDKGFHIDALLAACCSEIRSTGLRVGGLVQSSEGGIGGDASSVHLFDLRKASAYDIWEQRGACASGCRLDEAGLDAAAAVLDRAIDDHVDLLIINRFGRAESLGRGFLPYFVRAFEGGIPVLTSVRPPYDEAWEGFHGGLGAQLPCDHNAARDWALSSVRNALPTESVSQFPPPDMATM